LHATDFIRDSFRRLHRSLEDSTQDLSLEQLNFTPDDQHHSIAWILWHAYRTEDLIRSRSLQGHPDRWSQDGWSGRLGLPEQGQGTGMPPGEAQRIRIEDYAGFMQYARIVADDTDAYLATLTEEQLEEMQPWRSAPGGQDTLAAVIGNHVMTHIYGHRNEIYWLRSLQGLKGSPN
jgi:uncharacterized damage-inducible protein DinB